MLTSLPLRILLSEQTRRDAGHLVAAAIGDLPHWLMTPEESSDFDFAFVSRDVTGLSTKHEVQPGTAVFYDAMLNAPSLKWVQLHSAGADRPVFVELGARGVRITPAAGANASVVAQTAVGGLLALARQFPKLMAAQRQRRWAPLIGGQLPRDLQGQTATIVGWGPIGQQVGAILRLLGLQLIVVRTNDAPAPGAEQTVAYEGLTCVLPRTDWLLLACPLTDRTRGLVGREALASLPSHAHLINVGRGELVDEAALVEALATGRLGGAFLDVFEHEPLPQESPLWAMDNVIASPHSAGFSDGNSARVLNIFLNNLRLEAAQLANASSRRGTPATSAWSPTCPTTR